MTRDVFCFEGCEKRERDEKNYGNVYGAEKSVPVV